VSIHYAVEQINNKWYVIDKIAGDLDERLAAGPFDTNYLAQAELYNMLLRLGCSTGKCED
jgi:hypothetical protein